MVNAVFSLSASSTSTCQYALLMSKLLNHLAPYRESNISSMRGRNDGAPRSDSSPESVQSHDTVSTVVPKPQTSVIAWKADSSLDLDEEETSVLLDESVVRSEDGGITDRSSEGGDQEADISESDSEMDPGNESTEQMRLSPDGPSDPGTGGVQSSSREVRPSSDSEAQEAAWMDEVWGVGCGIVPYCIYHVVTCPLVIELPINVFMCGW